MKIYFINPYPEDLRMFYKIEPGVKDISSIKKLNIGYNDSYEMRSEYIGPNYFSDDPEKLEKILKDRRDELIKQAYKEIIEAYKHKISDRTNAIKHDSIDSPF